MHLVGGVDRRFVVVMKMNFSLDNFLGLESKINDIFIWKSGDEDYLVKIDKTRVRVQANLPHVYNIECIASNVIIKTMINHIFRSTSSKVSTSHRAQQSLQKKNKKKGFLCNAPASTTAEPFFTINLCSATSDFWCLSECDFVRKYNSQ